MATTFNFEELDSVTRDYLLEVRDREGRGTPGVFAPVKNPWPMIGCCLGPVVILTTLLVTLLTGLIYRDPGRVALLQTAGLLLGGWMFMAAFRVWARKKSSKVAGNWVYADPLYAYEASGEQVKVTRIDDAIEAQFTHNYSNGSYQNSVVRVLLPNHRVVSMNINHEQRAEQMVVYFNYLAWARGPDGGDRAGLAPAVLGGLAKYVAKNDNEPLDHDGNVNLNMVELDVGEVPEEPTRDRGSMPNILPYIALVAAGVACFFVMKSVNVPIRDDELYKAVTQEPLEPRILRMYLVDQRNVRHREDVYKELAKFYAPAAGHVRQNGRDTKLREGMAQVLESLAKADLAVVSIRVKEARSPEGKSGSADERAKKRVGVGIADKTNEELARHAPWGTPVSPKPGMVFNEQPPPLGHQLIAYVEPPEEAPNPHFDVVYNFDKTDGGDYKVTCTVTIRVKVEENPVATSTFTLEKTYRAEQPGQAEAAADDVRDTIIRNMIGSGPPANPGGFGPGGFPPPK